MELGVFAQAKYLVYNKTKYQNCPRPLLCAPNLFWDSLILPLESVELYWYQPKCLCATEFLNLDCILFTLLKLVSRQI